MKTKLKITYFVILGFLLFNILSCKNKDQYINKTKSIIYENRNNKLLIQEYVDTSSFKFIKLETKDDALFGAVDKVLFDKNDIFILDKKIANAVFIFDMQGRFISKIEKKGKGPGEYVRLIDFDVDRENKQIILYDLGNRKLIYYSYKGKYIKEIMLKGYRGMQFSYLGRNRFAFHIHSTKITNKNEEIVITKPDGEIVSKYIPRINITEIETQFGESDRFFASLTTNKYFIPTWSDKLYCLNINGLNEVFDLNIKAHMLTPEELQKPNEEKAIFKFDYVFSVVVTDDSLFTCKVAYANNIITIFCDMKTNKVIAGQETFDLLKPDRLLCSYIANPIASYKNYFVTPIDARDIKKYYNHLYKEVKDDDNPFLLFFKIKNINRIN